MNQATKNKGKGIYPGPFDKKLGKVSDTRKVFRAINLITTIGPIDNLDYEQYDKFALLQLLLQDMGQCGSKEFANAVNLLSYNMYKRHRHIYYGSELKKGSCRVSQT